MVNKDFQNHNIQFQELASPKSDNLQLIQIKFIMIIVIYLHHCVCKLLLKCYFIF